MATVYLYAQWFHYTRQSYGISRMYLRKAGAFPQTRDVVLDGVIYALPLWGILYRSYQQPDEVPEPRCALYSSAAHRRWGSPAPSVFGSHIGLVATATIGDDQRIKVHRLAAAVDCGRIVKAGLVDTSRSRAG